MDWQAWHAGYDDPDSALSKRLAMVQTSIRMALATLAAGPVRVVSVCAGDGRDLLGVLEGHPRAHDVCARLVELDVGLTDAARDAAARLGLTGIEVLAGDAGIADSYLGAVPADVLLLCGVLGNLTDGTALNLLRVLPAFCAPGAFLVWTRHRRSPDLTDAIRAELTTVGFTELMFGSPPQSWAGVGTARWDGRTTMDLEPGTRLFEFVADRQQLWQQPR